MERVIEALLYWSRWLLVPIYFGLAALLIMVGVVFLRELWLLFGELQTLRNMDMILAALTLIDLALVASLIVMMALSGYENFVSRFEIADHGERLYWLGKLDAGGLKLKLGSSIVAISSIHLLKTFMQIEAVPTEKLIWLVAIHMTFVFTTLLMAVVERVLPDRSSAGRRDSAAGEPEVPFSPARAQPLTEARGPAHAVPASVPRSPER
jgi:uncharacterized protein (TIGR00645 family)